MAANNKEVTNLHEGVIKYLDDGRYCDLTIRCGTFSIQVHKVVVCSQSTWFENAVKLQFIEGQENLIVFDPEEAIAVRSLVQYLYSGDYNLCDDSEPERPDTEPNTQPSSDVLGGGYSGFIHATGRYSCQATMYPYQPTISMYSYQPPQSNPPPPPPSFERQHEDSLSDLPKIKNRPAPIRVPFACLAHLEVYALGDLIGLIQLKRLSEAKFDEAAAIQCTHPDFHRALAKVYQVAPPGHQGDALRSSAVAITSRHLDRIRANDRYGHFSEMMAENGPFSRDVAFYKF